MAAIEQQPPKDEEKILPSLAIKQKLDLLHQINSIDFCSAIESYTCMYCAKLFSDLRVLKSHLGMHTGERPFPCAHCQRCFKNKYQLRDHLRVHTGEKPFKCPHCPKAFAQKNQLNLHLPTHNSERPFVCGLCNKSFKIATTLQTHLKFHSDERPYVCPICQFAFHLPSLLRSHMRTHTGERPYPCKFCGKRFKTASTRKVHERSHEPEPAFKCPDCDRSFTYASNLAMHRRTHKEKDQHSCIHCGQSCLTAQLMKQHIELVHGNNFKCNVCKESFPLKAQLNKHLDCHKGDNIIFTCYHCHKNFQDDKEFRQHMTNLPCVKLYGCGKCEQRFETISQLNGHMWSHKPPRSNRRGRPPKRYVENLNNNNNNVNNNISNNNNSTSNNNDDENGNEDNNTNGTANVNGTVSVAENNSTTSSETQTKSNLNHEQNSLNKANLANNNAKPNLENFQNSALNILHEPRLFCGICFSEHANNEELQNHLQESHPIEDVDKNRTEQDSPGPPKLDPIEKKMESKKNTPSNRRLVHTLTPANHSLLQKYITVSVSDDDLSEETEEMQFREFQFPVQETSRRTKRLKQGWRFYLA